VTLWCGLALWFDFPWASALVAGGFLVGVGWRYWTARREVVRVAWVAGGCAVVLVWWFWLPPSNERVWNPTGKVLAVPEWDGNRVTVRNLRNFLHTSPSTFEPRYTDVTFNLDELKSVDLLFDDFLGPGPISHTMMSFGFAGGPYLCLTIEPRREESEAYSVPRACFKGFEIIYYLGDERDIVYQCTNILHQDVYLYRLKLTAEQRQRLCRSVLNKAAKLAVQPEWYNFITNNCTNNLLWHGESQRIDWREYQVFLNGWGAPLLYERGLIATHLPFADLKARSRINDLAGAAGAADDFSRRIRVGMVEPQD
jgi:hypothetical protein